jgi:hypothetical protein
MDLNGAKSFVIRNLKIGPSPAVTPSILVLGIHARIERVIIKFRLLGFHEISARVTQTVNVTFKFTLPLRLFNASSESSPLMRFLYPSVLTCVPVVETRLP